MKIHFIWIGLLWFLISCGKADPGTNSLDGTYVGYFHRNNQDTIQVSLLFNENQYSGFRDKKFCPTLGKGTFEVDENSISFNSINSKLSAQNLSLKGKYSYEVNLDGSVRIWKEDGKDADEYILRKSYDESLVYGY